MVCMLLLEPSNRVTLFIADETRNNIAATVLQYFSVVIHNFRTDAPIAACIYYLLSILNNDTSDHLCSNTDVQCCNTRVYAVYAHLV